MKNKLKKVFYFIFPTILYALTTIAAIGEKSSKLIFLLPISMILYSIFISYHIKKKGTIKYFKKMYFGIFLPYILSFTPIFFMTTLIVWAQYVSFLVFSNETNYKLVLGLIIFFHILPIFIAPLVYRLVKKKDISNKTIEFKDEEDENTENKDDKNEDANNVDDVEDYAIDDVIIEDYLNKT